MNLSSHRLHYSLGDEDEDDIQGEEDEEGEVDVEGDFAQRVYEGVVEDEYPGVPEEGDEDDGEDQEAASEPARSAPVLVAGPEFGGHG